MKILFVERIVEYIDPMHIELLSALAKREGHSTYLSILAQNDLKEDIERIKPDLIAFGGVKTGEHTTYLRAAKKVKEISKNLTIIMGGPHLTFFPELIENENVDAIGVGECDQAWPDFLNAFDKNGMSAVHSIPNIYTKENWFNRWKKASYDERRMNLANRKINLDDLPFYDREIVYNKTHLKNFPMRSFMSSRGCPFQCSYCFEPIWGAMYRGKGPIFTRYSVKRLCAELKEMKDRWPTQFIKFYDDIFWVHKKVDPWIEEFAEVYPREVGKPFFCLTRCNILTENHLKLLKPAGLHSVTMSIEAGNDYVRNDIIKRHMTREEIITAFHLCNKYKIKTFANTIMAIPVKPEIMKSQGKTSIDYDIESLDINIECKVTFGEFTIAYPYPGCELSRYAEENGWFSQIKDFDKLHHSYQSQSPMKCFTKKEKMMQANLALLGTICLFFPWLRNLIVNVLIKLPLQQLYYPFYFLIKGYLNIFEIYPMNLGFWNLLTNIFRSYFIDKRKHSPNKNLY